MAVASSLATTLSLLPLHHASAKSSFLSFSLLSPNLSLRLSRASSPRLYAAPEDSDQFELDEGADDEDDSDQFELDEGADDEDDSDQFELDEGAVEEDDSEFTQPQDDLDKVMDDAGFDVNEEGDEDESESDFVDIGVEDEVTTETETETETESPPRKKKSAMRRGKVRDNGLEDGVVTVEDIRSGFETRGTELAGIDRGVLIRALKLLEQKGKAVIFKGSSADDEGVKFSA